MTRPGVRGVAAALLALAVSGAAAGCGGAPAPYRVTIEMDYSRFRPAELRVPAGRPVEITLVNADPIDHEWIVGDAAIHDRHRAGTEPTHGTRPTEVSVPALERRVTTVTFPAPTVLTFVCHLPGHESYGMVGTLIVG